MISYLNLNAGTWSLLSQSKTKEVAYFCAVGLHRKLPFPWKQSMQTIGNLQKTDLLFTTTTATVVAL